MKVQCVLVLATLCVANALFQRQPGPPEKCPALPSMSGDEACNKLADGKATCVSVSHCDCLEWVAGKCGGGGDRKCCTDGPTKKRAGSSSSSSSSTAAAAVNNRGITFEKLVKSYPQGETPNVKKWLGGSIDGDWISNTCAIRMSHTIQGAGLLIPKQGDNQSIRSKRNPTFSYIFRVAKLRPWLISNLRKPDLVVLAPGGPKNPGVPIAPFAGKRGIITFEISWSDASGHFDLWDGSCMVEYHHITETDRYFGLAVSVALWEFPAENASAWPSHACDAAYAAQAKAKNPPEADSVPGAVSP